MNNTTSAATDLLADFSSACAMAVPPRGPVRLKALPTTSALEARRWLLSSGAHEVELIDDSEETWLRFCQETVDRSARSIRD